MGIETNSKIAVQLAAGQFWEKGPVDLSIVERKFPSARLPKQARNGRVYKKAF
jgi:hypothetical protein